jgi:hypothetical protein
VYAGHAAIATLVKGVRPRISLALLVPIAFAPDWLEWSAGLLGFHDKMLSHSLLSVAIGATVVAAIYALVTRELGDAIWVWTAYASHWPADFITGIKPTWPGGPSVGLLLYDHAVWDVILESTLIIVGWLIYKRTLNPSVRSRAVVWVAPLGLIALQIASAALQGPNLK